MTILAKAGGSFFSSSDRGINAADREQRKVVLKPTSRLDLFAELVMLPSIEEQWLVVTRFEVFHPANV